MLKPDPGIENGLSTVGAVLWTVQIIPQIVKSYRSKSTLGLSASLMALWAFSSYPFSAYIVAQRLAIPLQVQPHAFGFLCAISWMQCLYYGHSKSKIRTLLYFMAFIMVWAGFETGSIYALWAAEDRGISAPSKLYGYLSAVMLAGALLPQYWEIYKLKKVVGISLIFMAVDILGGVFSLLSLLFRAELDVAACVSYGLVVVLDGIVVILAFILNPIARRREAKRQSSESVLRADLGASTPITPFSLITPTTPFTPATTISAISGKRHDPELPARVSSRNSFVDGAPQHFRWSEDRANHGRSGGEKSSKDQSACMRGGQGSGR